MYDAIVIGAGIIGASTGYYLAKKGLKVAIIEKEHPASGASGACNGGLSYFGKKGQVLQAAHESLMIYRELPKELESSLQICQDEIFIQLAATEEEVVQLEKNVEECVTNGLDAQMITKKQLHALVPELSEKAIAAAIAQGDLHGFVNPFDITHKFLTRFKMYGGKLLQNSEATDILTINGKIKGVACKDRLLSAPVVTVCAGYETTNLLKNLGIQLNIIPSRGAVLVSEKVPFRLNKKLMGANFGNSKDKVVSLCIEQSLDGNLLIGSSHELGAVSRRISSGLIRNIARNALSFYPPLGEYKYYSSFYWN